MSGGPLLRPRWRDEHRSEIRLDVVGVIVEYREGHRHQMVASRISSVVAALAEAGLVSAHRLPRVMTDASSPRFILADG